MSTQPQSDWFQQNAPESAASGDWFAANAPPGGPKPGEVTNDVGNTVIVPKPGEPFADTMKRAAAYGQTVTPQQVNSELATVPKKSATVALSALLGGAAAPAAMAGVGELTAPTIQMATRGAGYLMQEVEQQGPSLLRQGAEAVAKLAAAHKVTTGAIGLAVLSKLGIHPSEIMQELLGK